jgi:hypothetical protein
MYTEENKYSGNNDNFDYKLVVFNDLCERADIPQAAKGKAYPITLRGPALNHYCTNLRAVARTLPLHQVCDATRNYFEGPEYRRGILGRWEMITLKSIMAKNEDYFGMPGSTRCRVEIPTTWPPP